MKGAILLFLLIVGAVIVGTLVMNYMSSMVEDSEQTAGV